MAGFKRINPANPTAKRPLRVEDLADLWEAIVASRTFPNDFDEVKIVSGFTFEDGTLTAGTLSYSGELYYYDGTENIQEADQDTQYMYVGEVAEDIRTLSDGSQIPFAFKRVVTKTPFEGGERIGPLTTSNINRWRSVTITPRQITGGNIALDTVQNENIAEGAIYGRVLADSLKPVYYENYAFSPPSGGSIVNLSMFGSVVGLTEDGFRVYTLTPAAPVGGVWVKLTANYPTAAGTAFVTYPKRITTKITLSATSSGDVVIDYSTSGGEANRRLTIHAQSYAVIILTFNRFGDMHGYIPSIERIIENTEGSVTWADEPLN